ncbi:hypothetical protein KIPB_004079, partial [Kipferlia bialata]|eukprot:g4079.t1
MIQIATAEGAHSGFRLLCICYGFQALSKALGYRVCSLPSGVLGVESLSLCDTDGDMHRVSVVETHTDCVVCPDTPPCQTKAVSPPLRILATSCPSAHYSRVGTHPLWPEGTYPERIIEAIGNERVLGVQFHPEFTPSVCGRWVLDTVPLGVRERERVAAEVAGAEAEKGRQTLSQVLDSNFILSLFLPHSGGVYHVTGGPEARPLLSTLYDMIYDAQPEDPRSERIQECLSFCAGIGAAEILFRILTTNITEDVPLFTLSVPTVLVASSNTLVPVTDRERDRLRGIRDRVLEPGALESVQQAIDVPVHANEDSDSEDSEDAQEDIDGYLYIAGDTALFADTSGSFHYMFSYRSHAIRNLPQERVSIQREKSLARSLKSMFSFIKRTPSMAGLAPTQQDLEHQTGLSEKGSVLRWEGESQAGDDEPSDADSTSSRSSQRSAKSGKSGSTTSRHYTPSERSDLSIEDGDATEDLEPSVEDLILSQMAQSDQASLDAARAELGAEASQSQSQSVSWDMSDSQSMSMSMSISMSGSETSDSVFDAQRQGERTMDIHIKKLRGERDREDESSSEGSESDSEEESERSLVRQSTLWKEQSLSVLKIVCANRYLSLFTRSELSSGDRDMSLGGMGRGMVPNMSVASLAGLSEVSSVNLTPRDMDAQEPSNAPSMSHHYSGMSVGDGASVRHTPGGAMLALRRGSTKGRGSAKGSTKGKGLAGLFVGLGSIGRGKAEANGTRFSESDGPDEGSSFVSSVSDEYHPGFQDPRKLQFRLRERVEGGDNGRARGMKGLRGRKVVRKHVFKTSHSPEPVPSGISGISGISGTDTARHNAGQGTVRRSGSPGLLWGRDKDDEYKRGGDSSEDGSDYQVPGDEDAESSQFSAPPSDTDSGSGSDSTPDQTLPSGTGEGFGMIKSVVPWAHNKRDDKRSRRIRRHDDADLSDVSSVSDPREDTLLLMQRWASGKGQDNGSQRGRGSVFGSVKHRRKRVKSVFDDPSAPQDSKAVPRLMGGTEAGSPRHTGRDTSMQEASSERGMGASVSHSQYQSAPMSSSGPMVPSTHATSSGRAGEDQMISESEEAAELYTRLTSANVALLTPAQKQAKRRKRSVRFIVPSGALEGLFLAGMDKIVEAAPCAYRAGEEALYPGWCIATEKELILYCMNTSVAARVRIGVKAVSVRNADVAAVAAHSIGDQESALQRKGSGDVAGSVSGTGIDFVGSLYDVAALPVKPRDLPYMVMLGADWVPVRVHFPSVSMAHRMGRAVIRNRGYVTRPLEVRISALQMASYHGFSVVALCKRSLGVAPQGPMYPMSTVHVRMGLGEGRSYELRDAQIWRGRDSLVLLNKASTVLLEMPSPAHPPNVLGKVLHWKEGMKILAARLPVSGIPGLPIKMHFDSNRIARDFLEACNKKEGTTFLDPATGDKVDLTIAPSLQGFVFVAPTPLFGSRGLLHKSFTLAPWQRVWMELRGTHCIVRKTLGGPILWGLNTLNALVGPASQREWSLIPPRARADGIFFLISLSGTLMFRGAVLDGPDPSSRDWANAFSQTQSELETQHVVEPGPEAVHSYASVRHLVHTERNSRVLLACSYLSNFTLGGSKHSQPLYFA